MLQRMTAVHLDCESFKEALEITRTSAERLELRGDITLNRDGVDELIETLHALRLGMCP